MSPPPQPPLSDSDPADGSRGESESPGVEVDAEPDASAVERRSWVVDRPGHGERLDKLLAAWVPEFSRSYLQSLIERGHVQIDAGVATAASRRVKAGQSVAVDLVPTAESQAYRPQPMALTILHEDEDLLVIDKPAGLVVHPAPGNWSGTLLNGLLARYPGAAGLPRAGIVHRLDKDTSGVMMVGKTLAAVTALVRDLGARAVSRQYLALAWGDVGPAPIGIDAPIGRDPVSRLRMAVVASGKPARTDIQRVALLEGISALRCRLHSGRTHQIRVHLASRGHPLLADSLYGGREALGLARQALHAGRLQLAHPVTRQTLTFVCPLPADMAGAWRAVAGTDRVALPDD